ncbi:DUF29 domain-containing protein [Pannus brasiliensis CCIBt3594]|uniref:DUF29 domain-containing protein n=1 Tax=Pannus brasiliensis CCIBt3594 TaxID=1427578 RepID=A0AAW9QTD2_9CHRO
MTTITPKGTLYDTDYYRWVEETLDRLRSRDYEAIDWENLIEEVTDLGISQKQAIESLTTRLLEHFLKLAYWEAEREYNARKWRSEIVNFRRQILKSLRKSPSLKPYLRENYPECLEDARKSMSELFDLPIEIPITLDQALDEDWFPEIDSE